MVGRGSAPVADKHGRRLHHPARRFPVRPVDELPDAVDQADFRITRDVLVIVR
jgi:hypothetical protein